jgi:hypothetical protein
VARAVSGSAPSTRPPGAPIATARLALPETMGQRRSVCCVAAGARDGDRMGIAANKPGLGKSTSAVRRTIP